MNRTVCIALALVSSFSWLLATTGVGWGQTAGDPPPRDPDREAPAAAPEPPAATPEPPAAAAPEPPAAVSSTAPGPMAGDRNDLAGDGNNSPGADGSLIEEDVAPTIRVYDSDAVELRMGGLVQMHLAPWVGNDSLVDNDDPANREGFRLRRARVGVESVFRDQLKLLLVVNPLDADSEVGTVSDARITWLYQPWLRASMGTTKVPFSRAGLESSRALSSIERPQSARTFTPERRLGVTVEGEVLDRRLAYLAGFMNATEGYDPGNQFGGFLYGLRLQYAIWGQPDSRRPAKDGLAIGLGALYEDGPATKGPAASVDIMLAMARANAKIEAMCIRKTPQEAPETSPEVADDVDGCGAYVEVGYTLPLWPVQPVVRAEIIDDNRSVEDAGDEILVSAGVNSRPHPNTRLQLHYLHKRERHSVARSNDAVVLNVQGEF